MWDREAVHNPWYCTQRLHPRDHHIGGPYKGDDSVFTPWVAIASLLCTLPLVPVYLPNTGSGPYVWAKVGQQPDAMPSLKR